MLQKIFFVLVFMGISVSGTAQISDVHYLPPLKQRALAVAVNVHGVYLSTPETVPFTVNVYLGSGTIPLASYTISNTSPALYQPPNGDNNITMVEDSLTGIVLNNSGLRIVAPGGQKFYVNYRGRSAYQATSLTSKGIHAAGTSFKWGGVPNEGTTPEYTSSTLGIMATENNTTVTISGYDPNCVFRLQANPAGITSNSITVSLNAGESYVLEALNGQTTANKDGWIGAAIDASKPIVISNGGLNTGVTTTGADRDAGIDQPVPISKLGQDYVLIRGKGNNVLEYGLIIATEDNTEIYVNGNTTPLATINDGDYYIVPGTYYSGTTVGANMYIYTSKKAYAYQNMGGKDTQYNSGGLNFLAPVNCQMADKMDNISSIEDVVGKVFDGGITITASTSTPDSNITVTDGTGPITVPPFTTVTGAPDWKTVYIPGLTGNVSVQSTGAIAVGFVGVNSVAGIAGYFSGFDLVPPLSLTIDGTSDCIPCDDMILNEIEVFDSYAWTKDGAYIPGATTDRYQPTQPGSYQLEVVKGGCTYYSNRLVVKYCSVITNRRITYRVNH